jgi:hypothetical protein
MSAITTAICNAESVAQTEMFGQNRQQLRQFFFDVWSKMQKGESLTGLEQVLAQIISMHPEYHSLLQQPDKLDKDFTIEAGQSNPFLHMGLHISLHEQISTDRPAGIRAVYQQLLTQYDSAHDCEHAMMECLAEVLWQAQRTGQSPSDSDYLHALRGLLR